MSPIDAALDDLHDEQQRRNSVVRRMTDALHGLGYDDPLISERRAAYQSIEVAREDYSYLDYRALKLFNEERAK